MSRTIGKKSDLLCECDLNAVRDKSVCQSKNIDGNCVGQSGTNDQNKMMNEIGNQSEIKNKS